MPTARYNRHRIKKVENYQTNEIKKMLILKIDKSAANVTDMATYLNDVAAEVQDGKMVGADWEMTGEPEVAEAEDVAGDNDNQEGGDEA